MRQTVILFLLISIYYTYSLILESDCDSQIDNSNSEYEDDYEYYDWLRNRKRKKNNRHHGKHHKKAKRKVLKCPAGWGNFTREKGSWCIQVFSGTVNLDEAEKLCNAHGATMSGIENEKERQFIIDRARPYVAGKGIGTIWIGAKRTKNCYYAGLNQNGCTATTSFNWTDGMTSGVDGFTWSHGWNLPTQPDNSALQQPCVGMYITTGVNFAVLGKFVFTVGHLDDRHCVLTGPSIPGNIEGYVCGMKPT